MIEQFSKTAENKVTRITSTHVQVEVLQGKSKGKTYMIMACNVIDTNFVGNCTCSHGRKGGITCSHVRDAKAFLENEQKVAV